MGHFFSLPLSHPASDLREDSMKKRPNEDFICEDFTCNVEAEGSAECCVCGKEIRYGEWFAIDEDGSYFCAECAEVA